MDIPEKYGRKIFRPFGRNFKKTRKAKGRENSLLRSGIPWTTKNPPVKDFAIFNGNGARELHCGVNGVKSLKLILLPENLKILMIKKYFFSE